ncbi:MAG TPA: tripartite tricarboxylate transporter substrate binding protein [Alicycliphilus sp.]|nr:tripartite tricarboxylate transporter substrate binding protein [Alicycliphilus sp.]
MLKRWFITMSSALVCLTAQAAYPERPIQIVVPYSAGGIADIMARRIANELTTTLKTSVVVQNKGGGSAIIGTQAVAKAAPDGYTILFTPNTPLSINPLLRKNLPYNASKDLEILSILAESPIVVVARPQLGLKSLRDMAALARTKKGGLNYSAVSAPGPLTLPMNKLQNELGFDMTPVPYQGAGEAMNAVLAGNVDVSINALGTALPYIKSGKVTALAVGTDERLKDMPGVETIGEIVPGFKTSMWYSLSVPAGVPQNVRDTLQKAFEGLRQNQSIREAFARDHLVIPGPRTSAELQKFLADDLQRWKKVIDDNGIKPN